MSVTVIPRPELPPWATTAQKPASLTDALLMIRRRWLSLALSTILIPLTALTILTVTGPSYTATGIMLYDPLSAAPPGDIPSDIAIQIQDSVIASQAAIITSLPAARAIAASLNLAMDPAFNPAMHHRIWSAWLSHPTPDPDAVPNAVRAALTVTVPPNSNILTVSFTAQNPIVAAAAANTAMQTYLDSQRDQSFNDLAVEEVWLSNHDAQLQTELDKTEASLAQARAAAGIVSGEQVSITTETASELAASLVNAKADLAMAQARLASAGDGDAAEANAAIAPNMLPLRKEAADLTAQINSLSGEYGSSYPDLVSDRAQLRAIDSALGQETGRELESARADVAADGAQVSTLDGAVDFARRQAQAQDAESGPIRALEEEEGSQKAMLGTMEMQADQLAQAAALTKQDARILSAAAPPDGSASSRRPEILIASVILGVCFGLLLVQLDEHLDTSFCSGGDIRGVTGLACLALVPEVHDPLTAALTAPLSLYAEQIRCLRAVLVGGRGQKIVAVTAARPGEGKTTLTVGLARALSVGGGRILVIDGDVRQPSFDAIFGLGGAVGLTDYLAGLVSFDEIVVQDSLSSVRVIGSGCLGTDALSLFLSPALPALLEHVRGQFDVVLIDIPPAFALAEAAILARLADAALLCVRWGSTPRRVVVAAIMLLAEARVNVLGAVLTRVDPRRHRRSGFPDAEMYQPRYGGYFRL